MANNRYTVEKEINGVKYTAQFNGLSAALDAVDSSYIDGSSNISARKMAEYLFAHVIVDPKVSIDDFANVAEMNKVTDFAREVMQGNFRNQALEGATAKKG